jgi:hypothetical protein
MRTAIAAAVLSVALFSVSNPAHATDMDSFRSDDFRGMRWPRLSEQIFRVDKWSLCRVRLPSGEAAA